MIKKLNLARKICCALPRNHDFDTCFAQLYSLKVDRLENPKKPAALGKEEKEDWTGCQADAIEHLCTEVR